MIFFVSDVLVGVVTNLKLCTSKNFFPKFLIFSLIRAHEKTTSGQNAVTIFLAQSIQPHSVFAKVFALLCDIPFYFDLGA